MPYFIYVDYVYLNDIDELPKRYHEIFIHNICHDINIMTPSYIFREYLIKLPRMSVENTSLAEAMPKASCGHFYSFVFVCTFQLKELKFEIK